MTNILENLNGVAAIGVGIGLMTVVGQCIGAGRDDEAVYYIKKFTGIGEVVIMISWRARLCSRPNGNRPWRHGTGKRSDVSVYAHCHHDRKAARVDILLYSGLWHARCR